MTFVYIVLGIFVLAVLYVIFAYNRFVSMTARVKEAWADIDVQLKRRYDLIPNLVETVKGYAQHEKGVFENVAKTRALAMQAGTVVDKSQTENMLAGALKSLFAVSENYPELKANENFLALQNELSDTENKIQAARRFYNGNVRDLNTALGVFPGNAIGSFFHFQTEQFFDLPEGSAATEPVKVDFSPAPGSVDPRE